MAREDGRNVPVTDTDIQEERAVRRNEKIDAILAEAAQKVRDIVVPRVAALVEDGKFPVLEIGTKVGKGPGYPLIVQTDEILGVNLNAGYSGGFSGNNAIVLSPDGLYNCGTEFLGDGHGTRAPIWKDRHRASDLNWIENGKRIVSTLSEIQRGGFIPGDVRKRSDS